MAASFILIFCRVTIGLVFALSSLSKVRNISEFKRTIQGFQLLQPRMSGSAALLFLCGEFSVVLLIAIGGPVLFYGFALALFLLFLFCFALASVLRRQLRIACNCFGSSEKPVTSTDLWRNAGFILCATGGCGILVWGREAQANLDGVWWLLALLGAVVFVLIWVQLGEIAQLFRQS